MAWQFAVINSRLAKIYFDELKNKTREIRGHCYVNEKTRWTSEEKMWVTIDKKHNRFSYRNKRYRSLMSPHVR